MGLSCSRCSRTRWKACAQEGCPFFQKVWKLQRLFSAAAAGQAELLWLYDSQSEFPRNDVIMLTREPLIPLLRAEGHRAWVVRNDYPTAVAGPVWPAVYA